MNACDRFPNEIAHRGIVKLPNTLSQTAPSCCRARMPSQAVIEIALDRLATSATGRPLSLLGSYSASANGGFKECVIQIDCLYYWLVSNMNAQATRFRTPDKLNFYRLSNSTTDQCYNALPLALHTVN